jgi:type IV secretion system protein VirD4
MAQFALWFFIAGLLWGWWPFPVDLSPFSAFFLTPELLAFSSAYGLAGMVETVRPILAALATVIAFLSLYRAGKRLVGFAVKHSYWWRRLTGKRIYGSARWAKIRDLEPLGMVGGDGLFLGNLDGKDIRHNGEGHLLTIGGSGGGKSTGLVVPTLITLKQGAVIVTDPSGELAAMTGRRRAELGPVFYLNPFADYFQKDTGMDYPDSGFNPLSVLDPASSTFFSEVQAFSRLLMVNDRKESGSYFNDEGAEFVSLMISAIILYDHRDLHTLEFLYSVVRDSTEAIQTRLEWIIQRDHPALRDEAQRFLSIIQHAQPQWQGIISKAGLATKRYAPSTPLAVHTAKNGFDASLLKTQNVTVYVIVPSALLATALPWLNMLMGVLGMAVGKPGPRSPVTMLIDECPSLGFLPDLQSHLQQFRKVGLRIWMFTQTRSAMAAPELYGESGFQAIEGVCDFKQYFSIGEGYVQKQVSEACGNYTVSNPNAGGGMSDIGRPLITPDEVRGLPKFTQILTLNNFQFPLRCELVPFFNRKEWRVMVDPNPYRGGGK